MNTFKKIVFWTHLVAGLVAGTIIFVMSFTGTILAFEDEIVAWAERDVRRVEVPATGSRLDLEALDAAFAAAHPEVTPTAITVESDPTAAVTFAVGRNDAYYVNPYTGEVRQPASNRMHDFMHTMVAWHRWLGREGDSRTIGKAITGASNTAFVLLALTGLYLWWPQAWRMPTLRRSIFFVRSQTSKARDWNWHNVIGFWLLIPIIIMALTGMVISYRWAGNLIYQAVGEEPPVRRGPRGAESSPSGEGMTTSAPSLDSIYVAATTDQPAWKSLNVRLPVMATASVSVKVPGTWPRTASTELTVADGIVTERSDFGDLTTGRQLRTWSRFLHTGQALGWGGQLIAGIGCIGGCFLVYTGFALSWRRFFGRKTGKVTTP